MQEHKQVNLDSYMTFPYALESLSVDVQLKWL